MPATAALGFAVIDVSSLPSAAATRAKFAESALTPCSTILHCVGTRPGDRPIGNFSHAGSH